MGSYYQVLPFTQTPMTSHATTASHCPNCGAAVGANYCAQCGQETRLHVASASEFFHEFIGHYVALEGKLWQTLWLLITRPGKLTAEYIAGRRARYVAPLRVYLSLSLLFFALLKFGPGELIEVKHADSASNEHFVVTDRAPDAETVRLSSKLKEFNPRWETRLREIEAMPAGQAATLVKNKFFSYVPYAMFLIMPVFALYLKVLFLGSRRRYGEHMLFALHANAFAFMILGLIWVAQTGWIGGPLFIWLLLYLPLAMQRVYGGKKWLTVARWLALMLVYSATVVAVILGVVFATTIVF